MTKKPKEDQNKEPADKFDTTLKRMLETPPKPHKEKECEEAETPPHPLTAKEND